MFKNLKLAAKMSLGFGVLIVISGLLGAVSWMGISQITETVTLSNYSTDLMDNINLCAKFRRDFGLNAFKKDAAGKDATDNLNVALESFNQTLAKLNAITGLDSQCKSYVQELMKQSGPYKRFFDTIVDAKKMRDEAFVTFAKSGGVMIENVAAVRGVLESRSQEAQKANDIAALAKVNQLVTSLNNNIMDNITAMRMSSRQLVIKTDEEQWKDYQGKLAVTQAAFDSWKETNKDDAELTASSTKMLAALKDYVVAGEDFHKGMLVKDVADKDMAVAAGAMVDFTNKIKASLAQSQKYQTARTNFVMILMAISGIVLGVILAIIITRSIVRPINRIIAGLNEGSEQVSSASGQVSAASQSLAEGATEQAAGLEETSSSLEEMSSMTKQSAENAQKAATLAVESTRAAQTGDESMKKMSVAINDIEKSSNETAKIIKVIDEIAFQTNLLALNAAVEAARAGEAGKGFAVVAEEVRNLAMRSAEAAKNTSAMIEESVKNAKNGVSISNEVGKVLQEIVGSVSKTAELVNEIAASSNEQAKGIDQVNVAVAQMDKVTQSNAANAEESASASEELNAQAQSMKDVVNELVELVGGANSTKKAVSSHTNSKKSQNHLNMSDHAFHQIADRKGKTSGAQKSSKLMPLTAQEDADLAKFNS